MNEAPSNPQSNRCSACGQFVGNTYTGCDRDRLTDRGALLCDQCLRQVLLVSVKSIRPVGGHGNLRAFAVVEIGPITVSGCRVIQQPGQRAYVAGPQTQNAHGDWRHLVRFSDQRIKDQVQKAVLSAWEECKA